MIGSAYWQTNRLTDFFSEANWGISSGHELDALKYCNKKCSFYSCRRSGVSIPIPSGRSLLPVKNGGRNLFLNDGYFSRKSLKLMPPDALISAQNASKCVWRQGSAQTRWGSSQRSPDPLAGLGPTFKAKGGECTQFCIQI